MKTLSLAWSGIASFAKRKLYFLLIIFLSFTVSMVGILFFFSAFVSRYESSQSYYKETRTVKLQLKQCTPQKAKSVVEQLQGHELPQVQSIFLMDRDILAEKESSKTPVDDTIVGEYDNNRDNTFNQPGFLAKGEYFTGIQDDRDVCIVDMGSKTLPGTENSYAWKLGMEVALQGKPYQIIGLRETGTLHDATAIPVATYLREGRDARYVLCVYDRALTKGEIKHLQTLAEDDAVAAATLPSRVEAKALQEAALGMMLYLAAFLLCLVNLIVMVQYWIASNLKTYRIYAICGGSKGKVIRVQLASCMLLAVGACALGAGIYAAVLRNRLLTLSPAQEAVSWAVSLGTVLVVTFILSLVATVWFLRKRDLYAVEGVGG